MERVYESSKECCGCEACVNACPKAAISMEPDEKGFRYPVIDPALCVDCGRCRRVCPLRTEGEKESACPEEKPQVFAAVNRESELLRHSASGGVFGALASWTLAQEGLVFGCGWEENQIPVCTGVREKASLRRLQGSKYVQGRVGASFREVREALEQGSRVLFSGTPCQCDGLRSYLGREYEALVCLELICHGVPSDAYFRDYLRLLEEKWKGRITDVAFRDKKRGWGALLRVDYVDRRGKTRRRYLTPSESYYYHYYWNGYLYRDVCYGCPYARQERRSDFTMGDFWGVGKAHPELDATLGASLLLVNTAKARRILPELEPYLRLVPSSLEAAKRENGQLTSPSVEPEGNNQLWETYLTGGAGAMESRYRSRFGKQIWMGRLKRHVPLTLKRYLVRRMTR